MDCVTCMLMGMCMLCGPGFGGSNVQTSYATVAADPGRPLTKNEFAAAVRGLLDSYDLNKDSPKATPSPSISYNRRRSFSLDPKFASLGIGKRNFLKKLDPRFGSMGIGKKESLDPRFVGMGIGKRDSGSLDPNLFGLGIGKRDFESLDPNLFGLGIGKRDFQRFDPKFASLGIGKRNATRFAFLGSGNKKLQQRNPYLYFGGIGDQNFGHSGILGVLAGVSSRRNFDKENSDDVSRDIGKRKSMEGYDYPDIVLAALDDSGKDGLVSGMARNNQFLSMNTIPLNLNTNLYQYIINHMIERAKVLAKSKEVLDEEKRKLQLRRRQSQELDPVYTMMGIGR